MYMGSLLSLLLYSVNKYGLWDELIEQLWNLDMWAGLVAEFTLSLAVPADFIESCILVFIPPSREPQTLQATAAEVEEPPPAANSPMMTNDDDGEFLLVSKPSRQKRLSDSRSSNSSLGYGGTGHTSTSEAIRQGSFENSVETSNASH